MQFQFSVLVDGCYCPVSGAGGEQPHFVILVAGDQGVQSLNSPAHFVELLKYTPPHSAYINKALPLLICKPFGGYFDLIAIHHKSSIIECRLLAEVQRFMNDLLRIVYCFA